MLTGTPTPEGIILSGDPNKDDVSSMYDVFSEQEDYFFKKMNRRHFEDGTLVEHTKAEQPRERTVEEFSDDELRAILGKPFQSLQQTLNKTKSVATIYRIQSLARDMEKSEKVMKHIESRLSEVQETPKPDNVILEEL